MSLKNKINRRYENFLFFLLSSLFLSILVFFSFFSSLPLVSATSLYSPVPDICIPYNTTTTVWLDYYYDIDPNETLYVGVVDFVDDSYLYMSEKMSMIWRNPQSYPDEDIYWVGYLKTKRESPHDAYDIDYHTILIESFDKDLYTSIDVFVASDDNLFQSFQLNISEECVYDGGYNDTTGIFDINDQNDYNAFANLYNGNIFRFCQKMTIPNMTISNITLNMGKGGSPPGNMQLRIKSYPSLTTLQSSELSASDSSGFVFFDFESPPLINEEVVICLEYDDGDAGNYVRVRHQQSNVKNDENISYWIGGTETSEDWDLTYSISWDNITTLTENAPSTTNISNLYLNGSQNFSLDLNDYVNSYQEIYIHAPNPYSNSEYTIKTGYSMDEVEDFYGITLQPDGILNITSFPRAYSVELVVDFCNIEPFLDCESQKFYIDVTANLSQVIQRRPLLVQYNLGFEGSHRFQANDFFSYYDDVTLTFPESNFSGLINDTFPFNYTEFVNETTNETSFLIFMMCDVNQTNSTTYYYLGDLNITFECGLYDAHYTITTYNNYNHRVFLTGCNFFTCQSDYTQIITGNPDLLPGQAPPGYVAPSLESQIQSIESNKSFFEKYIMPFSDNLPDDANPFQKGRISFIILFVAVISFFVLIYKTSLKLAFVVSGLIGIFILFVLAGANYFNTAWPLLISVVVLFIFVLKIVRGG